MSSVAAKVNKHQGIYLQLEYSFPRCDVSIEQYKNYVVIKYSEEIILRL